MTETVMDILGEYNLPYYCEPHGLTKMAQEVATLRAQLAGVRETLDRVVGMCDVPPRCECGRPNGLGAVVACAKRGLAALDGAA